MRMEKQRLELIEFIKSKYNYYGNLSSQIPNLDFYISKAKNITHSTHIMYDPSICVILQGVKAVCFGVELYTYRQNEYLIASTLLPATVKILDTKEDELYVSFRIKFTLEDIYEVLKNIDIQNINSKKSVEKGLFFDKLNDDLYDAFYRLIKLFWKKYTNFKTETSIQMIVDIKRSVVFENELTSFIKMLETETKIMETSKDIKFRKLFQPVFCLILFYSGLRKTELRTLLTKNIELVNDKEFEISVTKENFKFFI